MNLHVRKHIFLAGYHLYMNAGDYVPLGAVVIMEHLSIKVQPSGQRAALGWVVSPKLNSALGVYLMRGASGCGHIFMVYSPGWGSKGSYLADVPHYKKFTMAQLFQYLEFIFPPFPGFQTVFPWHSSWVWRSPGESLYRWWYDQLIPFPHSPYFDREI